MNFFDYQVAEDAARRPKTETLAEHKKHCKAEKGECPFERSARRDDLSDDLSAGAARQKQPTSLSNLDRHVALKERAWMKEAKVTPSEFKTIQANLKALMADITSRFPIGVSVRSTAQLKGTKVIREILRSGFKNIYETKEGGGTTDPTIRRQTEAANFGWSDGFSRKMRADDRPKYGMLANGYKLKDKIAFYKQMGMTKKEIAEAVAKMPQPNEAGVVEYGDAMYGRNFITLKKDRVDATFTVGDSMDNLLQKPATTPSRLSEPSPASLAPRGKLVEMLKSGVPHGLTTDDIRNNNGTFGDRYIEIQLHGRVPPEAIDEIRFADKNELANAGFSKEDWDIIKRLGIKVLVGGQRMK